MGRKVINISDDTYARLVNARTSPKESFDKVLNRILDLTQKPKVEPPIESGDLIVLGEKASPEG